MIYTGKEYHEVLSIRKCPKCGSKDYERGVTGQRITRVVNKVKETYIRWTDAEYFKCLKCNFEETMNEIIDEGDSICKKKQTES